MARLKVFSLGNNGFIGSAVRDALGEPRHIRQAAVLVVAATKAAAIEVIERARSNPAGAYVALPTRSDPEFRVAAGNDVAALRAAGLLDTPTVLVTSNSGGPAAVVQVGTGGVRRIGTLRRSGGGFTFVAEEG